jgi:hypothetical protein
MTNALTLTEAAERLAPIFTEDQGSTSTAVATPKGKWLSLDDAAAVLTHRVTGKPPAARKAKKAEVSVKQAAKQIEEPYTDLAEIRQSREAATQNQLARFSELQVFTSQAAPHFQGMDDEAVLKSPEFQAIYAHAVQLRATYDAACREEADAWNRECKAENDAFEAERPGWTIDDAGKVWAFLSRLGVPDSDIRDLWQTPLPINVSSPACLRIAQLATGIEGQDAIPAALASVGFSSHEIRTALTGATAILLRDHRIQELVARAVDADTPPENRAAA